MSDNEMKDEPEQEWLDFLDAVIAAPEHHKVLLENERVRVLDARIKSGDTVPVHTHRWSSVLHVLSTSDFIRYDADGNAVFDSRTASQPMPESGAVLWQPPLPPHSVENVGTGEIRVITVELKD